MNQRLPRQSSDPICQDGDNAGCLPDGVAMAPTDLITCVNSMS